MASKKQLAREQQEKGTRRKQYLTANWDGELANDYFLDRLTQSMHEIDRLESKPKTDPFIGLKVIAQAEKSVYNEIYQAAYIKEDFINKLNKIINEINNDKFGLSRISKAKEILSKVMANKYHFQIQK